MALGRVSFECANLRDMTLDSPSLQQYVNDVWDQSIVPALVDYVRLPAKSPHFDADWEAHGHIRDAVTLARTWCEARQLDGLRVEVHQLPGRTPVLLLELPGEGNDNVLLYGHLDKQPEMTGWREGLGPFTPVIEGDKLYGRGGADDGYAVFASLTALEGLRKLGGKHRRAVVLIETCEESGSYDLPFYIDALSARIGSPSLVVCLDSGCGNYEQLWSTTSLRGLVGLTLRVDVLTEGVHSGDASGIVPSSFRLLRQLLSRVEDENSGKILLDILHADIPEQRRQQARIAATELGDAVFRKFPFHGQTLPQHHDPAELILNRTWRPTLSVTGAAGLPSVADAGNVLRPCTVAQLSFRLPPTVDAARAAQAITRILTRSPPSGCSVSVDNVGAASGWNAPPLAPWLERSIDQASRALFDRPAVHMGEGGSIPFMAMLGEKFPKAQFFITGVLGPGSNAHGPNEFLHIPMGKRLTAAVAQVLSAHYSRTD